MLRFRSLYFFIWLMTHESCRYCYSCLSVLIIVVQSTMPRFLAGCRQKCMKYESLHISYGGLKTDIININVSSFASFIQCVFSQFSAIIMGNVDYVICSHGNNCWCWVMCAECSDECRMNDILMIKHLPCAFIVIKG